MQYNQKSINYSDNQLQPKSNEKILSKETRQRMQLNEEKLKVFISESDEPIPDIVNQPEETIYSHFLFYFNDNDLLILKQDQTGASISAVHEEAFKEDISNLFLEWKKKNLETKTNSSKPVYNNFIAFVEFWIRNSPNILVKYSPYDQMISSVVEQAIDNSIFSVLFSVAQKQKQIKINKQQKKSKQNNDQNVCDSLESLVGHKRLKVYFIHFSKVQGHSSGAVFSKNTKTFDQIRKEFSSLNLQQWIFFVKSFSVDKLFEENFMTHNSDNKKKNTRKYLKVKGVKWSSSLHYFKKVFEKFCDSSKQITFEPFLQLISKVFLDIFMEKQQLKKEQTTVQNDTKSYEQLAIDYLKIGNLEEYKQKLNDLGIFISKEIISVASPSTNKKYLQVKPKYMSTPKPKDPNGENENFGQRSSTKENEKQNKNQSGRTCKLPALAKSYSTNVLKEKAKEKRFYTLQDIMKQPIEAIQMKNMPFLMQQSKTTPLEEVSSFSKTKNLKGTLLGTNRFGENLQKEKDPSQMIKQFIGEEADEDDEFLSHLYSKNEHKSSYQSLTPLETTGINTGSGFGKISIGKGYGNSINFLKRIDERIDKIHNKLI